MHVYIILVGPYHPRQNYQTAYCTQPHIVHFKQYIPIPPEAILVIYYTNTGTHLQQHSMQRELDILEGIPHTTLTSYQICYYTVQHVDGCKDLWVCFRDLTQSRMRMNMYRCLVCEKSILLCTFPIYSLVSTIYVLLEAAATYLHKYYTVCKCMHVHMYTCTCTSMCTCTP